MASFSSIVDALVSPVGNDGRVVTVRIGGRDVGLKPVPAVVDAAVRRALPKPAVPMVHKGGSLSPRVPADADSPEFARYRGELEAWFLKFRATMVAVSAAHAQGALADKFTDADAKAAAVEGDRLAAALTLAEIDRAFDALDAAGADVSPQSLALAEKDLIVRPEPGEAGPGEASADFVEASKRGGDGVTLPYVLPPAYGYTPAYFAHHACELYGCTPDAFLAIDAATRVRMIAYARLRWAEKRRDADGRAALAAAGD